MTEKEYQKKQWKDLRWMVKDQPIAWIVTILIIIGLIVWFGFYAPVNPAGI